MKNDRVQPSRLVNTLLKLPAFRNAVHGRTLAGDVSGQLAALAVTTAALLGRFALDPYLPPGFPYLTFFPGVIVVGFIWGLLPATTAAVCASVAALYWFIPPKHSFELNTSSIIALIFFYFVVAIDMLLIQLALHAVGAQVRAHQDLAESMRFQQVVSEEVDHRMKNLLASFSGLITLSQRHASTPVELGTILRNRVSAMSHSVTLLRDTANGAKAGIRQAAEASLLPLGIQEGERLSIEGDDVVLTANAILPLNMIFHELGTNAIKYGALSTITGKISLRWHVATQEERQFLWLDWSETGGPPVVKPDRTGFGTELLTRMAKSMGGFAEHHFEQTGLRVSMRIDCTNALLL